MGALASARTPHVTKPSPRWPRIKAESSWVALARTVLGIGRRRRANIYLFVEEASALTQA